MMFSCVFNSHFLQALHATRYIIYLLKKDFVFAEHQQNAEKGHITTKSAARFKFYTGYDWDNFTSVTKFTQWLHRPVDAAALGVFRMFFGIAMLIDLAEERGGSQMDIRFGDPKTCHFPLFDIIQAFSFPVMGMLYLIMWIGAMGIALGYRFKLSCLAFTVPYWYIFLLDKPAWNNHSYLFGLCGVLLMMTNANRSCSIDYLQSMRNTAIVPYWNYFLIKFQFFILYTYAGLKKLSAEWLSGYAMSSLGHHWVFAPFRTFLSAEMTDLLIVHWFTAIFDFSIAFLMTSHRTRIFATPFMLSFHLMNSRLFTIGMFPWVCLAEVPLFFGFNWPSHMRLCWRSANIGKPSREVNKINEVQEQDAVLKSGQLRKRKPHCQGRDSTNKSVSVASKQSPKVTRTEKLRVIGILMYCCAQIFLPYSHFITKGYNNWTNGLYGYSWDMMVHSYDTVLTSIKIIDNNNGNVHFLEPFAFTQYDRWTKSADMAVQYAKCIHTNLIKEMAKNPKKNPLSSSNISIYFDIWCSMNGRFQQRVFNPTVDLLSAYWSPFEQTTWSLPLLNELNHMRPKLKSITDDVLSWSNYSDVIFVADFPGLTLENFVSPELTNVTLTVIEGRIIYKNGNFEKLLHSGQSLAPTPGETHQITTKSLQPSCYLYTYVNKTMENLQVPPDETQYQKQDILPLWKEFLHRINNYRTFLYHLFNSIMYLCYGVPMPISLREQ